MGYLDSNQEFDLYKDIAKRTQGEIYIGVVGPVRTGKSTFIKKFMELFVLPQIENEHEKERTIDELPQSSGGKTITTTEPKFIPKNAVEIQLTEDVSMKVRLIDCVGFMVEGAIGHLENDTERMVETPWSDEKLSFTKAAEIGTNKVIQDHSTIGIVVTTDGSFGELPRYAYKDAERKTIAGLQKIGKPFIIILNTTRPYSQDTLTEVSEMEKNYHVRVLPVNVEQLDQGSILEILEQVMYEFPVSRIAFHTPKWLNILPKEHELKCNTVEMIRNFVEDIHSIRDVCGKEFPIEDSQIKRCSLLSISLADGAIHYQLDLDEKNYYELISQMLEEPVEGEYQLIHMLEKLAVMKKEYQTVQNALESVKSKGYGVVTPGRDEITLESPSMIKTGNKYGVKIKAVCPSIHFIKANVETEIAPIVGTQQQAQDLIDYISDSGTTNDGIWETNIFGKTVEQLVSDGINNKISMIGEDSQIKLQDTMQKIVNDTNGGMVCIII